ncbi:MAG: hypothetical protein LBD41_01595 [Clostridiales Family XIII bacterium]|jgi:hypothetical protein|nr:hypothetical protein [Clostridiales Family XIII bacterium]
MEDKMTVKKLDEKAKALENAWTSYLFKEAYKEEMEEEIYNYYSKTLKYKRDMTLDEKLSVIWQLYLKEKAAFWRKLPEDNFFFVKKMIWKDYLFRKAYGYPIKVYDFNNDGKLSKLDLHYLKEHSRFLEKEIIGKTLEKFRAYAKTGFVLEWIKTSMYPDELSKYLQKSGYILKDLTTLEIERIKDEKN